MEKEDRLLIPLPVCVTGMGNYDANATEKLVTPLVSNGYHILLRPPAPGWMYTPDELIIAQEHQLALCAGQVVVQAPYEAPQDKVFRFFEKLHNPSGLVVTEPREEDVERYVCELEQLGVPVYMHSTARRYTQGFERVMLDANHVVGVVSRTRRIQVGFENVIFQLKMEGISGKVYFELSPEHLCRSIEHGQGIAPSLGFLHPELFASLVKDVNTYRPQVDELLEAAPLDEQMEITSYLEKRGIHLFERRMNRDREENPDIFWELKDRSRRIRGRKRR